MTDPNRKYKVLFVDDEPRVTNALKAIFRREYDVLIANSGAQALKLLSQTKVDVIVSDQRMPEMLGNELLASVSIHYPQTMRILLTGFMDREAIVNSINDGEVFRFINKPWNNDEMREVVAEAALASEIPVEPVVRVATQASDSSSDNAAVDAQTLPKLNGDLALLMIEQGKDTRNQIRKFCSSHDIMIYGTQNIEQAIAAAATRESIGVAVIELTEDTSAALQTIHLLKQARPELIAIALTDEYDTNTAVDLINRGQVFKYLAKPLDLGGFQRAIHNAFLRHSYLKKNKEATKRFRVEKTQGKISSNIQALFGRLLSTSN